MDNVLARPVPTGGNMAFSEKRWRAEEDARNLAEAENIKNDPKRMSEAKKAAERIAKEDAERVAGMRKVAGKAPQKETGKAPKAKSKKSKPAQKKNQHNVFQRI